MATSTALVSACRFCQYYTPEGRRGGQCKKLGAAVESHWKSCSLAIPAFSPSWEELQQVIIAQESAQAEGSQFVHHSQKLESQMTSVSSTPVEADSDRHEATPFERLVM